MSVRATSLAYLFGAMVLGGASAAERPPAPAAPVPASNDAPVASEVRLAGDDSQTRLVLDLSQKIDVRAFTLANPYRVVMDMPQVTFRLPPKTGEAGRGLIKAFRFGLVMQGGSRIVIDLARPARVDKAFVIEAANDQPARLVVDLAAVDREAFLRTVAVEGRPPERKPPPPADTKAGGDTRPVVVIDPGHGGIDNGTRAASGEMEKTIVLEFSLMLRDKIEKTGKYRVFMTRTEDAFVALGDRVQFARGHQASLFISIHADALRRREGDAQGATVYTLSERASDARAARLAAAENQADVIAGLDLAAAGEGRGRHPHRSRPARNQDLLAAVRPRDGHPAQEHRQAPSASAEVGSLRGAQGARCAIGPGRARLCHQQGRPEIADIGGMARPHRGFHRPGGGHFLHDPAGGRAPELTGKIEGECG